MTDQDEVVCMGEEQQTPPPWMQKQAWKAEKPWQWEEDGYTVTRTSAWSAPGCHEGCGVLLYTQDGVLKKVEGDPEDPFSRGRLCPRCLAFPQVEYHPDRIKYPMKRVGARGEKKWERISWDEALDTCEREMRRIAEQYGPETFHFWRGTGRDIYWQAGRLGWSYGSPNEYGAMSGTSCYIPRLAAQIMTIGGQTIADFAQFFADRYDNPEWRRPETILLWGCNPVYSNPDFFMGHWITDAMKTGSKLVTVDPRVTWLAAKSDIHLQLRPGTDGALALGLLNVISNEGLYDREFVDNWTYGFDQLAEAAAPYTPERVSEITWVPAEKIVAAARVYAESKPASVVWGLAIDMQKQGVPAATAINALWCITGNLDVPGGNIFTQFPMGVTQNMMGAWGFTELLSDEQQEKRLGIDKYPMYRFGLLFSSPDEALLSMETGKPYPAKGAWIQSTNPMAGMFQDPKRWYKVVKDLEFVAAVDIFMTPTIEALADIVMPVKTFAEKKSFRGTYYFLSTINDAVTPVGEAKSDAEIDLLLGRRFSKEAWPWDNEEEILDEILTPSGMSYQDLRENGPVYPQYVYRKYEKGLLRPDGQPGFMTPSGRIELYSTLFDQFGLPAVPFYEEPAKSPVSTPDLMEKYPLILMSGVRSPVFFHSEHRQIPYLRQLHTDPFVEIHPDYARGHGIVDGDWVWIENDKDRIRQRAKVNPGIHPKCALGQHGWWFPEKKDEELYGMWDVNINRLLETNLVSQFGFGADIKCSVCKIYKVKDEEM